MDLYQCIRFPLKLTKRICDKRRRKANSNTTRPGVEAMERADHIACRGCDGVKEVVMTIPPEQLVRKVAPGACIMCGGPVEVDNINRRYCSMQCKTKYIRT